MARVDIGHPDLTPSRALYAYTLGASDAVNRRAPDCIGQPRARYHAQNLERLGRPGGPHSDHPQHYRDQHHTHKHKHAKARTAAPMPQCVQIQHIHTNARVQTRTPHTNARTHTQLRGRRSPPVARTPGEEPRQTLVWVWTHQDQRRPRCQSEGVRWSPGGRPLAQPRTTPHPRHLRRPWATHWCCHCEWPSSGVLRSHHGKGKVSRPAMGWVRRRHTSGAANRAGLEWPKYNIS